MGPTGHYTMLSCAEAVARLTDSVGSREIAALDTEQVALENLDGRILAADIRSSVNVPDADNSAMDGYAVRMADLTDPGVPRRVSQIIYAGQPAQALEPGTVARIFTGAAVPSGADAVLMQEVCIADAASGMVTFTRQPFSGEAIRRRGEDIRENSVVLSAGTRLNPVHIGLIASAGLPSAAVRRRLRVAIFFTGDELLTPGEPLPASGTGVYNSNRYLLRSLLERLGCEVSDYGIVADSLDATRLALRKSAQDHDLVLTSGGVSVGDADFVKPAVEAEGELALWRIAMKPGKPLAAGTLRRADGGTARFIGLPGNPVSTLVTFCIVVRPFLLALAGAAAATAAPLMLPAGFTQNRADDRQEFLRARIGSDGTLVLFENQGSGVLTSAAWADGLIDNPAGCRIRAGDLVRFLPFSSLL